LGEVCVFPFGFQQQIFDLFILCSESL